MLALLKELALGFGSKPKVVEAPVEPAGFPGVAVWLACVPLLLGFAFMSDCKNAMVEDISHIKILKKEGCSGVFGGFCAHIFFMVGIFSNGWGFTALAGALGFAPELAGAIGVVSINGIFLYMELFKTGPTGLPGIAPPAPVTYFVTLLSLALLANAACETGVYPLDGKDEFNMKYWVLMVVAALVPQAIGFKIRNEGFQITPVAKGA
jgi:hypothetical protein